MRNAVREVVQKCRSIHTPCVIGVAKEALASPELAQALKGSEYELVRVDASPIKDKQDLWSALAKACRLTSGPTCNWSALEDGLSDNAYATAMTRGQVLVYLEPLPLGWSDLGAFLSVMETARLVWAAQGKSLKLLLPDHMGRLN